MLRMIIVDDEKAIRESIHTLIDWDKLGITIIGLCKNGAEAYDMILDEYPDIILTDIKMPGLTGLELISRITQAQLNVEFVILSGYGEFEFAKEAMHYGVKHYLLKPTSEAQIIEVMKAVKEDCFRRRINSDIREKHRQFSAMVYRRTIQDALTAAISGNMPLQAVIEQENRFIDFENTNYELCYFYYLEEKDLAGCLRELTAYQQRQAPGIDLHLIYVNYALIVFFKGYASDYAAFDSFAAALRPSVQYERVSFQNLADLLGVLVKKLRRFETVSLLDGENRISLCNYSGLLQRIEQLTLRLKQAGGDERRERLEELTGLLSEITDIDFLSVLVTSLLLKHSVLFGDSATPANISKFLTALKKCETAEDLRRLLLSQLDALFAKNAAAQPEYKDCAARIIQYVEHNLDNPQLSLKWLAENQLFMNVDYLSKQFARQTGERFSAFLTRKRIEKAMALLASCGNDKIYNVAEAVGCGNNPQYFSQIFKRAVGMTPSEYSKSVSG